MNFNRGKVKDFYLLTTDVENLFINEYLPGAPGEYVKVYLYGLLYAQLGSDMTHREMETQLGLSEKTLEDAWNYWEKMGVIKKIPEKGNNVLNFDIEYVNLREEMYGNFHTEGGTESVSAEKAKEPVGNKPLYDVELKKLFDRTELILGRPLSPAESGEIASWISQEGATPALIEAAFDYCCRRGKANVNYVCKVVLEWNSKGLKKEPEIQEYISNLDERQGTYRKILNSLGLSRNATQAEKKMIDYWIDELGFNTERILSACDKTISLASPNLRYVNKVLENWAEEATDQGRDVNQKITVTQAVLNKYYEHLRSEAEIQAENRRREVYEAVPRIKDVDEELKTLGSKMSRGVLTGMSRQQLDETRRMINLLEEERAVLLTESNFSTDYTDIKYSCDKCSDTGIDEKGNRCACAKERIGEAELWQKQKEKK